MSFTPTRLNTIKRRKIYKARRRIITYARRNGSITNDKARKLSKFDQVWFHLQTLVHAGVLQHTGYDCWEPVKRKPGRPGLYNF
jgi:hypothetical protein